MGIISIRCFKFWVCRVIFWYDKHVEAFFAYVVRKFIPFWPLCYWVTGRDFASTCFDVFVLVPTHSGRSMGLVLWLILYSAPPHAELAHVTFSWITRAFSTDV